MISVQENAGLPKPFFGRRWAINKLARYVNSDSYNPDSSFASDSSPRTVLIVGGSGCGKTSLIGQIVQNRSDALIYPLIGCAVYAYRFLSPLEFLLSMNAQLNQFFKTRGLVFNADKDNFHAMPLNDQNFETLSQQFYSLVVNPLLAIHWRSGSKVVLFIDDIDASFRNINISNAQWSNHQQLEKLNNSTVDLNDSVVSSSLSDMSSSKDNLSNMGPVLTNFPIVDLFLQNQASLPPWVLVVASCNRRSKTVIRGLSAYTACRKFILDDTKRNEVADDLRGYCQMRIAASGGTLFLGDNRSISEAVEKLLIKSNGCILYLEKAFDLLLSRCLLPAEVPQLPATLNGFYLWLCERAFAGVDFQTEVRPFFSALVREKSLPFDESLHAQYPALAGLLQTRPLLEHILVVVVTASSSSSSESQEGDSNRAALISFFHQSFASWLTDLKLSTRRFVVDTSPTITPSNSSLGGEEQQPRKQQQIVAVNAKRANKSPVRSSNNNNKASSLLSSSSQQQQTKISTKMQPSGGVASHSITFGPRQPQSNVSSAVDEYRRQLFKAVENGDVDSCQDILRRPPPISSLTRHLNRLSLTSSTQPQEPAVDPSAAALEIRDEFGQTPLILSSKCGFEKIVQLLIDLGANIEACDCDGWTPLRSAAWSGHMGVIEMLLSVHVDVNGQLDALPDGEVRSNGSTPLDAAILNGQVEAVRRLLHCGSLVNSPSPNDGRTPLMTACMVCRAEIVRVLLALGAEISARDSLGRTCLHMALLQGPLSPAEEDSLLQVMNALIDAGCPCEAVDNEGTSPLHLAASRGLVQACEVLLENDCDVDLADSYGRTALFLAASLGHEEALRMLLYWNASVDAIDAQGWSALSVAARFGDVGCVEMLLDRGLDENHADNDGSTPLHLAASGNHVRICEMLIERGARVDALGASSQTALMVAAAAGHVPVVTCLLRAGANPLLVDISGLDPLRMAVAGEHWPVVRVLARCADVNAPDPAGHPPLFTAAFTNSTSLATILLQCGAHPNLCDANGRTPLHVAAWQGHCEVLKILINFNANVNAVDNEGRSALHSAAWQGHLTACKLLLEAGAAVDHVCAQGATGLCIAAQEGHAGLVQLLLDFGANPNHVDQFGRTALRMALKNSHMDVVRILEGLAVDMTGGTGNSQTSNDSAMTRNTYTSGSGGDVVHQTGGAIVTSLSGGGIIISPAGTGLRTSSNNGGGSQLLQTSQIDSSTGDSQSGGGSMSFGVPHGDFLAVSNEKLLAAGGTRSFERGMRQRRSIANSNLVNNAGVPLEGPAAMIIQEDLQQHFNRGINVRRSLQPQPTQPPHYSNHRYYNNNGNNNNNQFISNGIEYPEQQDSMSNYGALVNAFDGFNISSLDEQAERLAEAYRENRAHGGMMVGPHGSYPLRTNEQMLTPQQGGVRMVQQTSNFQQHFQQQQSSNSNNKESSNASNSNKPQSSRFLSSLLKKMLPIKQHKSKQTNFGIAKQ